MNYLTDNYSGMSDETYHKLLIKKFYFGISY